MNKDTWSAAFCIIKDGIEVDIMEISTESRIEIATAFVKGNTEGYLSSQTIDGLKQEVS